MKPFAFILSTGRAFKNRTLPWLILGLACYCFANASYIHVKAIVAQWLIEQAWSKTVDTQTVGHRPWPWLDTWPVAKINVPRLNQTLVVLNGLQGQSLAFAPGFDQFVLSQSSRMIAHSKSLTGLGVMLIAGHNDTHFRFLKRLRINDHIRLQNTFGGWRTYRVVRTKKAPVKNAEVQINTKTLNDDDLILMTCYSAFQTIEPTQIRYLVHLKPVVPHLS